MIQTAKKELYFYNSRVEFSVNISFWQLKIQLRDVK